MPKECLFIDFFAAIKDDCRISPAHISIFMALLHRRHQLGGADPVSFHARDVLFVARCSGATFYKCLRQLHAFGYVRYEPSFDPDEGSLVWLSVAKDQDGCL